jgi:hypothetical protein
VFTDDDIVGVSTNVAIGATTLTVDTEYFVCNSNGETQFKLSLTPSILGINTIIPSNVNVTGITINFERKDAVIQDNILNYIQPQIQDTESFSYLEGNINDTIKTVSSQNETARFFITQKYRADEDRNTDKNLNYEGTISISDPVSLNVNSTGLSSAKSPGVYIGDTRAFSSDNNPWSEVGIPTSALFTNATEVATAELNFADNITIQGITTTSATSVLATTFTHKLPVVINGETYYLLLSA